MGRCRKINKPVRRKRFVLGKYDIKKGFMVKVSVKSNEMDIVRYFTKEKPFKGFLRYLNSHLRDGKVVFRQYRVN